MCGCRGILLIRTPILILLLLNAVFAYSRSMGGLADQGSFNPPVRDDLSRSSLASVQSNLDSSRSMHSADNDTYLEEPSGQVTFPRLQWRSGGGVTLEVKGFGRKFRLLLRRVYSSDYDESIGGPRLYRGSGRGSLAAMEICGDAVKGEIFTRGEDDHFVLNPLNASQGCDLESGRRLTRRSESIAHTLRRERGGLLLEPRWNSTDSSWVPEQTIASRESKDECDSSSGGRYRPGCDRGPVVSASIRSPSIVRHRSRRSSPILNLEIAVFVDFDLFNYIKEIFPGDTESEIHRLVLTTINAVELLYKDPSLRWQLTFTIKHLSYNPIHTDLKSRDIKQYLSRFCKWQSELNKTESQKWDHALLLTGEDLYEVENNGTVLGLAPLEGMCTGTKSCALINGRDFKSVYVIAHEIGHNLGMVHDGPNTGNSCDPSSHIMSPTLGSGKITWSHCSRKFLERFLGTAQSACLFNKPKPSPRQLDHNAGTLLPGERFDADQQCMLKNGRESGRADPLLESICRDLQCKGDDPTLAFSYPALEGTECGSSKWCRRGQCVQKQSVRSRREVNDIVVDEGWSSWTECASACLHPAPGHQHSGSVGISYSTQKCNGQRGNRGSQLCQGSRRRYKTCHASQCANVPVMNVLDYAVDLCSRAQEVDETMTGLGSQRLSSDLLFPPLVWRRSVVRMCGCRGILLIRTPILILLQLNAVFAYSRSMGGLADQGSFNPPVRDDLSRSSLASVQSNLDSSRSMHSADNDTYLEEPSGQVTFPRLQWRSGGGVTLEVKGFGRKFRLRLRRVYSSDYDESIGGPRLYRGSGRGSLAAMEICGDAVKGEIFTRGEDDHFVLNPLNASQGCDLESGRRLTRRSESIAHTLRRERGGLLLEPRWNSTDSSWVPEQTIASRESKDECDSSSGGRYRPGCDRGPVVSASIRSPSIVRHRSRRSSPILNVEIAVFVDFDLFNYIKEIFPGDTESEIHRLVLTTINAVELLYKDPSLLWQLTFTIKRLSYFPNHTDLKSRDIKLYLSRFCKWQSELNKTESQKWDHALLLTGQDLYEVENNGTDWIVRNQAFGLAPLEGMCTGTKSCALIDGRDFKSVYVIAHEIGHNLGMFHDGSGGGNSCDPSSYIMSPTLGSGGNTWSRCSADYSFFFLITASKSACLCNRLNPPPNQWNHSAETLLPGERYNVDQQCMLKNGRESGRADPLLESICRDLQCKGDDPTWAFSYPALEGTECGSSKWCRRGQCVQKQSVRSRREVNDIVVDEGWSSWTECASACLHPAPGHQHSGSVGISYSTQKCNGQRGNRGSQLCQGSRRRYKTCHASQCANVPVMNVLDYAVDLCSRAQEVDETMTGLGSQRLSSDPVEACTVWCYQKTGGYKSHGWKFPDGTDCLTKAYNRSRPSYCIDGACQEFIRSEGGDSIFDKDDDMLQQASTLPQPQAIIQEASRSWGPWRAATSLTCTGSLPSPQPSGSTTCGISCHFACMAPGSGLRLVERECRGVDGSCEGPHASIQLCIPETAECTRLKTPFEHASQVCSGYREKVRRLSGLGMQISPSVVDPDRPCKVACQDESVRHRFYLVNGPDGWFPFGTECGRGVSGKKAFCVAGKCLDFGEDGVLLEHSEWQTTFRGFLYRRKERSSLPSTIQVNSSLDRDSLSALIERLDFQGGSNGGSTHLLPEVHPSLDLTNPVHIHL